MEMIRPLGAPTLWRKLRRPNVDTYVELAYIESGTCQVRTPEGKQRHVNNAQAPSNRGRTNRKSSEKRTPRGQTQSRAEGSGRAGSGAGAPAGLSVRHRQRHAGCTGDDPAA